MCHKINPSKTRWLGFHQTHPSRFLSGARDKKEDSNERKEQVRESELPKGNHLLLEKGKPYYKWGLVPNGFMNEREGERRSKLNIGSIGQLLYTVNGKGGC